MARRSSRRSYRQDTLPRADGDFRRGESYFHSSSAELPPPENISSYRRDDAFQNLLRQIQRHSEAVYPRRPSRAYRVAGFTFSPAKPRSVIGREFGHRLSVSELRDVKAARFCVQRKQRREVLFAKKRAGYSGSAKKRFWNRSPKSQWRC